MANLKLQGYLGVNIIPSEMANVPYPSIAAEGSATSTSASELIDTGANFKKSVIKAGDIVYNISTQDAATVTSVTSSDTLVLNDNIIVSGNDYIIYNGSNYSGYENAMGGCVLYCGSVDGDLKVTTVSGSVLVFKNLKAGSFFPVQVIKVWEDETQLKDIIGIW